MRNLFILLWLAVAFSALADTPVGPMNYQGRLLNDGIPVGFPTPTTANFVVKVYDAASGGTLKYQETHSNVTVDDGVYNFLVGTQPKDAGDSTWSVELWNCCANLYMEITANGDVLLPRSRLAAAPYAFQANLALTTNNALALGGKPSTWFDNTMEAICVSGKGKWLELANSGSGACLGIGAQFPGPAMVNVNTLTASTDFSGLDLTKANISGINFGNVNFTGTIFKNATINPAGFTTANLTGVVFDGVTTSGSATFTANFTNATIKNMSLAGWSMSGANFTGLSAAYITACPTSMPTQWVCRQQHSPSSGKYFLVGPNVNLSSTSALAVEKNNGLYLDFHENALWSTGLYLAGAQMTGVIVTQSIYFTSIMGLNLSNSTFKGAYLYALAVPQYGTRAIDFTNSTWENSQVWLRKDEPSDLLNFTNTVFKNSKIQLPIINLTPQYEFLGFGGAVFENTTITGAGGSSLPMTGVTFTNVVLDVDANRLELIDCKIYGGFAVDNLHSTGGTSLLETSYVTQARLTGRFDNWSFNENIVYHSVLDGDFSESVWTGNELNRSIMGNNFYNAAVNNNGNYQIGGIRWVGTCPDDDMASNEGNDANNYYCPITW